MDMSKFSDQTGSLPEFAGVVAAAVVCGIALFAHAQTTSHAAAAARTAATAAAGADATSRCTTAGERTESGNSQYERPASPEAADCR